MKKDLIRVNRLKGKFFVKCNEGSLLEPYFPDMKFEKKWIKFGYEVKYDLHGIDRSEK